jgi:hypothetical protein
MEDLATTPQIPSKETGDRQTRPSRFLLGFGEQEKGIPGGRHASIRGDMTESAWGRSTMAVVTTKDATLASALESSFSLANSP